MARIKHPWKHAHGYENTCNRGPRSCHLPEPAGLSSSVDVSSLCVLEVANWFITVSAFESSSGDDIVLLLKSMARSNRAIAIPAADSLAATVQTPQIKRKVISPLPDEEKKRVRNHSERGKLISAFKERLVQKHGTLMVCMLTLNVNGLRRRYLLSTRNSCAI